MYKQYIEIDGAKFMRQTERRQNRPLFGKYFYYRKNTFMRKGEKLTEFQLFDDKRNHKIKAKIDAVLDGDK